MLDFVRAFEEKYAELAPSSEELQYDVDPDDDLFPEFPESFAELPAGRTLSGGATRVLPLPRREPELAPPQDKRVRQPEVPSESDSARDLDEAMSLLRSGETRRAAAAASDRERHTRESAQPVQTTRHQPERDEAAVAGTTPSPGLGVPSPSLDWATRSHKLRSIAVVSAVLALIIGVVGGYVVGRSPEQKASRATIEATQQGGMKLRADSQLRLK